MIKRPTPGENEDDILRMQEQFLREKSKNQSLQPSAQVVNLRRTEHNTTKRNSDDSSSSGPRKPSKYAQLKGLTNASEKRPRLEERSTLIGDIVERNENGCEACELDDDKVYYPKELPKVLGEILEKNVDVSVDLNFKSMPSKGFPMVTERDPSLSIKHVKTCEKTIKMKDNKMDLDEVDYSGTSNKSLNLPNQSYIITTEAESIHSENIKLLSKLSETEILQEKKKLLTTLDPKLVEFLKNKRKECKTPSSCLAISTKQTKVTSENTNDQISQNVNQEGKNEEDDHLWENDVLSHPHVDKWLHFNSLETDKLQWIKGIQESKQHSKEPYEARFDFKGYLLPYTIEYSEKTKTLFHHGEESHRPGYSLSELIELSRSALIQQRVMALNTIAGILEYYNAGTYKDIIKIPISKLFFIIRISMDENKVIVLEPALKAMRNLIYNRIDEASLDALVGFEEGLYQPCLENDKTEIEEMESKESELKDFYLAEVDIMAALMRTDILQRLYYILDQIRPSFNCIQYSLHILIRLSRDSVDTSNKIINSDILLNTVLKHFMPNSSINFMFDASIVYNGKPILAALKLIRVLSLTSKDNAEKLITKYDVLKTISEYISSGVDGTYGLKLQIEALNILVNFVKFKLAEEDIKSLSPVIITTLYKHVQGTNIFSNCSILSVTHAAVLTQLIEGLLSYNINFDLKSQIHSLLKEGFQKWLLQLSVIEQFTCGHLRLISSILKCFETIVLQDKIPIEVLKDTLLQLCTSRGFKKILQYLPSSSNLLSGIQETDLHVIKNLISLGTSVTDSQVKVLPVVSVMSPIPVLNSLFKLLCVLDEKSLSLSFLEQIVPYLIKISEKDLCLLNNWFTRMETDFLYSIIKLAILSDIPETVKDLVYSVASKLCYILRIDKKEQLEFLFDNIIFNKHWFTTERLFKLVSLSDTDGFTKALTQIEVIKCCYRQVINLNYTDNGPFILYKKWQQPILPRDWIYLPILSLYSKSQEISPPIVGEHASKVARKIAEEKEVIVSCSLEWILFNELCFPELLKDINITDRFCRIMCVFLCDNSLFLEAKIKLLLEKCIQLLFKKGQQYNFDRDLVGLHNFQDFYTQLLEQFQSVSYGDHTFAACVLVPIAQRHNVKWRKLLWSEYAGCLRALDCPETLLCYNIKDYLYPEETDDSLLKSYFRALNSNLLRVGSIPYTIAKHHVDNYKERKAVKSMP